MTEAKARSRVWKNDPYRMTREEMIKAYVDLTGSVDKLRDIADAKDESVKELMRDLSQFSKAVRVAKDVIDSLSWVELDEDATPEARKEREGRLADVSLVSDYMGVVTENSDAMTSRFGNAGWDLILWAWGMRQTLGNVREMFNKVVEEAAQYTKEIVKLKGEALQGMARVTDAEERMLVFEANEKRVRDEKDKLYQEVKRLKEPKIEIEKAESRANRAEREAEEAVKVAREGTEKIRNEYNKYKGAVEARAKAYQDSNKRLAEEVADLTNKVADSAKKYDAEIKRVNERMKRLGDDVAFYKDMCDRNGVMYKDSKQVAEDAKVVNEGREDEATTPATTPETTPVE